MLKEMGFAMIGGVPIVRDVASSIGGFSGGGIYGGIIDGYARIFEQAAQGEADLAFWKALSAGAGAATGFPSTLTNRALDFAAGEATAAEFLMGRSPLTR